MCVCVCTLTHMCVYIGKEEYLSLTTACDSVNTGMENYTCRLYSHTVQEIVARMKDSKTYYGPEKGGLGAGVQQNGGVIRSWR